VGREEGGIRGSRRKAARGEGGEAARIGDEGGIGGRGLAFISRVKGGRDGRLLGWLLGRPAQLAFVVCQTFGPRCCFFFQIIQQMHLIK
jgi:hypothetical protein